MTDPPEPDAPRPDALGSAETRDLLARYDLRPRTRLGQHFVTDPNTVRRIVAGSGVSPADTVIEIGPGLGTLTRALAATGARVIAIETDRALEPVLRETVGALVNVSVRFEDAMETDWNALVASVPPPAGTFTLVANLPYQISTSLILGLLEDVPQVTRQTVMVQREVGDRITAAAGSDPYGAVSVKVAALATARTLFRVSRKVFLPQPEVESVVVRLDRAERDLRVPRPHLWAVIEAAFGQRRKTLRRALQAGGWSPAVLEAGFAAAGIDGGARGETLDLEAFLRLAQGLRVG